MSLLVISQFLELFVNNLIADDLYSRHNRENFSQSIRMQLSKTPKPFIQFFIAFPKFKSNFQFFEKKDEPHSLSISEITNSERHGYLIVEMVLFQNSPRQSMC